MNKVTLVIMAAGMGSRYGGIKQLEPVGPSGEIIMDYSIYDAIRAGFNKVVFIIRKDIEKEFKEVIGNRIEKLIEVEYVFQDLNSLPEGYTCPEGRTKPWGTGQAILSCKGAVNEPFAVINADDYYGRKAFEIIYEFLSNVTQKDEKHHFCMAGYVLKNTLSDNGTVTRGVCQVSQDQKLEVVTETFEIEKDGDYAKGKDKNHNPLNLDLNSIVSMNMWGFTPEFIDELDEHFVKFLDGINDNKLKAEFLLPEVVATLIKEEKAEVKVLTTKDSWFGVTYKEDKEIVIESFKALVNEGVYPAKLFN